MKVDVELLQKTLIKLYEVVQTIVQCIHQACEQVKDIIWFYEECEAERKSPRIVYGYVKDKAMRSQVLNRKPARIRARTTC